MTLVNEILMKLGLKKTAELADEAPVPVKEPKPTVPGPGQKLPPQAAAHIAPPPQAIRPDVSHQMAPNGPGVAAAAPAPAPKPEMSKQDLVTHLDYLAKTGPIKGLNWRVSINDFMALLGMDHSPEAIKQLAVELGCPEKEMMDSYTRNVWTHAALMRKLAENGGNVPDNLQKVRG